MKQLTTISIQKETKENIDKLKICDDETYNSALKRILPEWAIILKKKLNEETSEEVPTSSNEETKDSI